MRVLTKICLISFSGYISLIIFVLPSMFFEDTRIAILCDNIFDTVAIPIIFVCAITAWITFPYIAVMSLLSWRERTQQQNILLFLLLFIYPIGCNYYFYVKDKNNENAK